MASYSNIQSIIENEERPFWKDKLQRIYTYIVDHINSLNLFKLKKYKLSHYIRTTNNDNFFLQLGDNPDNFCVVIYSEDSNSAFIHSVHSNIGFYTGQFLLYIQLLCGYLYGIKLFTLNNQTNSPLRAAKGIYKLFKPDIFGTTFSENHFISIKQKYNQYDNLSNNNIQYLLSQTDDEMRLNVDDSFPNHFLKEMKEMALKIQNKKMNHTNIWNINKLSNLLNLFKNLLNVPDFNNTIIKEIKYKRDNKNKKTIRRNRIKTRSITRKNIK